MQRLISCPKHRTPFCGARNRLGGLCKHKGNVRKGRCKRHIRASWGSINRTFGENHHRYVHARRTKEVIRYVHGHRTKEVIAMRKLLSERYGWENAYYFTWIRGIQIEINAAKTKLWLGRI